ncbi:MAG: glycosyltransferase family 4 protein [Flavobacteriaceae bacterium]
MKILKVSAFPTATHNSSGLHVLETSINSKDITTILLKTNSGEFIGNYRKENIYEVKTFYEILKLINTIQPNIVSVHTYKYILLPIILKVVGNKSKFIYTFHGEDKILYTSNFFTRKIIRFIYDEIVTLDFKLAQDYDLKFFPNGTCIPIKHKEKADSKMPKNKIRILFPASFKEVKNHFNFIEFITDYSKKRDYFIEITFAGDGTLLKKCQDIAINRKNIKFNFKGNISHDELNKEYASCDLVVLPSFNEAFSKVWIEAISHNKLLLVTKVGSITSILDEDYPFYIESSLHFEKTSLILDKAITDCRIFYYEKINLKTWKDITQEYEEFYSNILAD